MTRRTVGRVAAHRRFFGNRIRSAGGAYSRPTPANTVPLDIACIPALLQLSSAGLPIGAFSHSLGLEAAVDAGVVRDADSAERWIGDHLDLVWARGEAPVWTALHHAWERPETNVLMHWNDRVLATRESAELLQESTQTGHSLRLWLLALPELAALRADQRQTLQQLQPVAYPCAHALATRALGLSASAGLYALGWSLLENLGTAAVKLVPLGQTQGQALLRRLSLRLPEAIELALFTPVEDACNFSPMLAIRSAQHESQYSRLFRS